MQKLIRGYERFRSEVYPVRRRQFEKLAGGQSPEVLLLTCSDSRIMPEMLFQAEPGELFVCRNAGNLAPRYGEPDGGVSGAIEFGVLGLQVKHIVVCGHSDCGAMRALLNPEMVGGLPAIASWVRRSGVQERPAADAKPEERLRTVIRENVLVQIENLLTHPAVASSVVRGDLTLHGWVYDIGSGRIECYDGGARRFVAIEEAELSAVGQGLLQKAS
ncbi:MAG: carbonic anhydrase [Bryobacteraceae bacterium]